MVVKSVYNCVVGILCFLALYGFDCFAFSISQLDKRSSYNDDAGQKIISNYSATSNDDVMMTTLTTPSWKVNLLDGTWYGATNYMKRELYLRDPNKRPTVCYSNVTTDKNNTILNHFICPMSDQLDSHIYCCGTQNSQHCCTKEEHDPEDDYIPIIDDIDVVTGISIAVGFVLSVSMCMFLYCCCCQRRPEIHDGIKLMWVRRSFGKELNRLEDPMYQNQLHVAGRSSHRGSRTGSRNPSRGGSPHPSRKGSRNPSRNASNDCSPSVSRRGSRQSPTKQKEEDSRGKLKVPGGVTITLTTPSDEQGPTNPLLKQTQEHIGLAICQVMEMKKDTELGIEFIQLEPEDRNDAYFRTIGRSKYWSQLGSSKNGSNRQQKQGREVIAQIIKEAPHQSTMCFTDDSCIKNPGPRAAGAVIYLPEDSSPVTLQRPVAAHGSILPAELVASCR